MTTRLFPLLLAALTFSAAHLFAADSPAIRDLAIPYSADDPPGPTFTDVEKQKQREAGLKVLADLQAAYAAGADAFTIPPGDYRYGAIRAGADSFVLRRMDRDGKTPFRILAHGATFWFDLGPRSHPATNFMVQLFDCANITLEGLTIDSDPRGVMEAKLAAFDFERNRILVEPLAGTQLLTKIPEKQGRFVPFKSNGRHIAALYNLDGGWGPADLCYRAFSKTDDGKYWFELQTDVLLKTMQNPAWRATYGAEGMLEKGDVLTFMWSVTRAIDLVRCKEITLRDCRVYAAKAITYETGYGGNRWIDCQFRPRPRTNHLLGGEGRMSSELKVGSLVDGQVMLRTSDDAFMIRGVWRHAESVTDRSITFHMDVPDLLAPGDRAVLFHQETKQPLGPLTVEAVQDRRTVVFQEPVGETYAKATCVFADHMNAGWIVRNSFFLESYQCTPLIQCGPGLFENNRIERAGAWVRIHPGEVGRLEGGTANGVIFRDNVFVDSFICPSTPGFNVNGQGSPLSDLTLEGNLICNTGRETVEITFAKDVVLKNNIVINPFEGRGLLPEKDCPELPAFHLKQVDGATIENNIIVRRDGLSTVTTQRSSTNVVEKNNETRQDPQETLEARIRELTATHDRDARSILKAVRAELKAGKTSVGAPFKRDDALGIHREDVAALNALTEQPLLRIGFLDVTRPPYNADPTGKRDATKAINDAIFFARHHKLAVWFPLGSYTISGQIECMGGWSDERKPNHPWLPFTEVWPCVLVGERKDGQRPRMVLAPGSPGFGNPERPKWVFWFRARMWGRDDRESPLPGNSQTNYHQLLYGIDIENGGNNPGAILVNMNAAEGSTIQDCALRAGDGHAALQGEPGSGGAIFNVTVEGGKFGMILDSGRPKSVVAGCRFSGQREAAVVVAPMGGQVLVGCEFVTSADAQAVRTSSEIYPTVPGSVSLVDCRIEHIGPAPAATAIQADTALYLRNTYVRNVAGLLRGTQCDAVDLADPASWTQVEELAAPYDYKVGEKSPVYLNGERQVGMHKRIKTGVEPPADLCNRHILWRADFPAWNSPGVVSVKDAPYNAHGDGKTDDTAALQAAIDAAETVFLPKGAYRITKSLRLKPRTQLIGISPAYSMICPVSVPGGDFNDPAHPRPAIQTSDAADAQTWLAFFSVFMPREDVKAASMLDWACGGRSGTRCINPITGYTANEILPLSNGIRPWHNWTWDQMDDFSLMLGKVGHFTGPTWHYGEGLAPDLLERLRVEAEKHSPDWPLIRVHGNGAGAFYPFYALDGRTHGPNYRRILVENTDGPFRFYHVHLQYCCGDAEMEIRNAKNITVFSTKNELSAPLLMIDSSESVLFCGFGSGGVAPTGKFIVRDSRNVTLAGMPAVMANARRNPLIRVHSGGAESQTEPSDYPVLWKWQNTAP